MPQTIKLLAVRYSLVAVVALIPGPSLMAQNHKQSESELRIVPRVLGTKQPEPTRSQNDSVRLDDAGNLVVEGARRGGGEAITIAITRRVHVRPIVNSSVLSGPGGFTYEYKVRNAPNAKQWIQIFWLDAFGPVSSARAPEYWRVYNIERSKPPLERVFFGRDALDSDSTRRLVPGASQDGFVVQSQARPGLVRFFFVGHKPLPGEAGYIPDEAVLESPEIEMSDWLRQEVNKYLSMETNAVVITGIGPKYSPSVPAVQALRNELLEAVRNPAFQSDRDAINALLHAELDRTGLQSGIQNLLARATGIRAELYSALVRHY
jgi:hypothetical protein